MRIDNGSWRTYSERPPCNFVTSFMLTMELDLCLGPWGGRAVGQIPGLPCNLVWEETRYGNVGIFHGSPLTCRF
jgi:hypothetical protein